MIRHPRRAARCGLLALVALVALACSAAGIEAQQPFTRAQALAPTAAVRVFSMAGSITVIGWAHDSIDVTGTVGAGLSPQGGGTRTTFKVTTYEGAQDARSPSHLQIRLPHRAQVWIKVASADVVLRGVSGSVEVHTIDGRIDVTGDPSELTAESMRGAVSVTGAPGWLRARSGAGAIRFDGSARDLALSTVSGPIVSSGAFQRGRFESVRGSIDVTGPLTGEMTADIDSHAGMVTLRPNPRGSAAYTVYSLSGSIVNELSAARAQPSRGAGRELTFATGTGTARITVRTFEGAVALRRDTTRTVVRTR